MTNLEIERLNEKIGEMAEIHGRKLPVAARQRWIIKLRDFSFNAVMSVIDAGCDAKHMPALTEVIEGVNSRQFSKGTYAPAVEMTPEQRKRSDLAAIMSMLWLHYEKRWKLSDIAGHALARAFGRDPVEALTVAKGIYSAEDVSRWMKQQEQAGY